MDVETSLRQFLLRELAYNGFHENIASDESLVDSGILDSLGILVLMSFLQEEFGVQVSREELGAQGFDTIAAIVHHVEEHRASGGGA